MNDDIRFYLGILRRRFLPFMIVTGAVAALATVIIFAIPPLYRSEATILVESQQIPDKYVPTAVTALADERMETTRTRITSRETLLSIVDKYGLFADQRREMSTTALIRLMRERIIIEPVDLKLKNNRSPNGPVTIAFKVGFDYERAETASKVANELVTLILESDQRDRTGKAAQTRQFLEDSLGDASNKMAKLEGEITKFKLENRESLPERIPFQMAALERSTDARKQIERDINGLIEDRRLLEIELKLVQNGGSIVDVQGGPRTIQSQIEALKTELATLSGTHRQTHPTIVSLKRQIDSLEGQALATGETPEPGSAKKDENKNQRLRLNERIVVEKIDAVDRQLKLFNSQKDAIDEEVRGISRLLSNAPEVQDRASLYIRQQESLQKSIDDLSSKLAQARLSEDLESSNQAERLGVVEQPITPQEPVWPKIPRLLAMGAGVAGMAGATVVGLLELINRSIRTSSDIVRAVNRHPIVVIPYIMTKEENRRRLRKMMLTLLGALLAFILLLLAVNYLFMPLDELYYKILNRMGV